MLGKIFGNLKKMLDMQQFSSVISAKKWWEGLDVTKKKKIAVFWKFVIVAETFKKCQLLWNSVTSETYVKASKKCRINYLLSSWIFGPRPCANFKIIFQHLVMKINKGKFKLNLRIFFLGKFIEILKNYLEILNQFEKVFREMIKKILQNDLGNFEEKKSWGQYNICK